LAPPVGWVPSGRLYGHESGRAVGWLVDRRAADGVSCWWGHTGSVAREPSVNGLTSADGHPADGPSLPDCDPGDIPRHSPPAVTVTAFRFSSAATIQVGPPRQSTRVRRCRRPGRILCPTCDHSDGGRPPTAPRTGHPPANSTDAPVSLSNPSR